MTSSADPSAVAWVSKKRNYDNEKQHITSTAVSASSQHHPLKAHLENSNKSQQTTAGTTTTKHVVSNPLMMSSPLGDDPLSAGTAVVAPSTAIMPDSSLDPLSKMVVDISLKEKLELTRKNEMKSSFEPWSLRKSAILTKYTTVEKLTITSSFLTPIAGAMMEKAVTTKTLTTVKDRLEQLDQFDDENMHEMANLSQQEYIKRIDELNNALLHAWNEDDRVKSLKIVIQCSKLLADTSVIQFYPSKFVLITDILDTFGKLVYDRIRTKSTYQGPGSMKPQPLPEKFTADIVPASAKETCRNWFFKIASIRELLPRIYVEASILKCMNFLSDNSIASTINRLVAMTAGIGDPLVAAYANCYICRVGVQTDPNIREHQSLSLENLLYVFRQTSNERVKRLLANQKVNYKTYLELYCPAIDWVLQCVANGKNEKDLDEILKKCVKVSNENNLVNGLLINSIMSSFEPNFVSSMAPKLVEMIKDVNEEFFPKHLLFRNLGMCLVFTDQQQQFSASPAATPAPNVSKDAKNKQDLQLLNDVWKIVTKFEDATQYIGCAEIWIEFTLKNFTKKEVNTLLGDIIKHVHPDRKFEQFYPQLQSIVLKILVYITEFNVLFSMDKFMQFLNLFQKESVKLEVCKSITSAFLKSTTDFTDDIIVTNSMMQICKSMHDYVNALTLDDEKREIAQMICSFINKVQLIDIKEKIENFLSFYSEARASFSNLDSVIALLVHKVNALATETLRIVNCNHTRKTAAFVRACVAFSFITIPSLSNPFLKLQLYLESSQVALQNQCLSQSDAFLKAAITLIPDVQRQYEANNAVAMSNTTAATAGTLVTTSSATIIERFLLDYLSNMMSTLLVTPDNPDQGVIYLLNGILNLLNNKQHFNWENSDIKFTLMTNLLILLSALKQENYIYHVTNVESDDTLYGSDPKFLKELNKTTASILDEALQLLATFSQNKQSQLALEFFNKIISHCDLSNEQCLQLAVNMWNLSLKSHSKLHDQLIKTIKNKAIKNSDLKSLQQRLSL